jgi:ubiquinone/menaquinone biosynthesis C-methylase UbiE
MHNERLKTGHDMAADWDARAEDNARYFIAEQYDDAEFRASGEREVEHVLLNDVIVPPDATVLEIGCGIGRLLRPLAARFRRVIGFDVSPRMIEHSREYLLGLGNVETYANDGSTLPGIQDDSVDYCFSFICFQHIPRKELICSYLREVLRVLRPGGIFKFQVDGQTWPGRLRNHAETWQGVWYTPSEIRQACLDTGYSVLYVTGGATQHLWVLCQKPTTTRTLGLIAPDNWTDSEDSERQREFLVEHPETLSSPPLPAGMLTQIRVRMKDSSPLMVGANGRFCLSPQVVNRSDWRLASVPPNPVFLSYHWMDEHGRKTIVKEGLRSGIYPPLDPDAHRSIKMDVQAPALPGLYVLRLTLVQENIRWFDAKPTNIKFDLPVQVLPGNASAT